MQLKIWQKGAVLVGVPLIFGISYVAVLCVLLADAEADLKRENQSKLVIANAELLVNNVFDAGCAVFTYGTTRDTLWGDKFERTKRLMPERLKFLSSISGEDSSQKESLRRIKNLSERGMEFLAQAKAGCDRGQFSVPFLTDQEARKEAERLLVELTNEVHAFVDRAKRGKVADDAAQSRKLVVTTIFAGVVVMIAMGIGLSTFFTRRITSRVEILGENSRLFKSNLPLKDMLAEDDEISEADRSFREMATALAEASRKERAMVDNALDVICSIDCDGKFKRVNKAAQMAWEFSESELLEKEVYSLMAADDRLIALDSFTEARKGKIPSFELAMRTASGKAVFNLWSVYWSEVDQSYFCVVHDITDRKAVESLKQEFVAMVSHDLRTPLSAVNLALDILHRGMQGELSNEAKSTIRGAQRNLERMLYMVNDLLDLERLEAGKLELDCEQTYIAFVIDQALNSAKALAEQKSINIKVADTQSKVYVDSQRIVQVLVNLIGNALKFSPEGGSIYISVEEESSMAKVKVKDEGRGVPEHLRAAIFDRFKQVDKTDASVKKGSGLGLAICKALISEHGGSIGVDSTPGQGSTFWFTVPLASRRLVGDGQNSGS